MTGERNERRPSPRVIGSSRAWGNKEFTKCPCGSGQDVMGLCTFPRVYSLCGAYTCDECGEINSRDDVRCGKHKGKVVTAADEFDLSL